MVNKPVSANSTNSHDTADSSDGAVRDTKASSSASATTVSTTSLSDGAPENTDLAAFFDRVFGVIDAHLCSVNEGGEGCELLLGALMRLMNVTVPLCIAYLPRKALQVLPHLFQIWETVRAMACQSVPVQRYCAAFLTLTGRALFAAASSASITSSGTGSDKSSINGGNRFQGISIRDLHRYKRRILYLVKVHYFSLYRGHDSWSEFVDPSVSLILGEVAGSSSNITSISGSDWVTAGVPSLLAQGGTGGSQGIEEYEVQGPRLCHHRYDATILRSLLPFLMLVVERDPTFLIAARMDVRFMLFLDQSHSRGTLSMRTALPSLEPRSRYYALILDEYNGSSTILQADLGAAIRALGLSVCTRSVESNVGAWVLFLRAAALGLRSADDNEEEGIDSNGEEGSDEEGTSPSTHEPSNMATTTASTSNSISSGSQGTQGAPMPLSSYIRKTQAGAVRRVVTLNSTMRIGSKRICLESCKDVIMLLLTRDGAATDSCATSDAHRSLTQARHLTKESLRKAACGILPSPPLPVCIPLFTQELLTFACALTTHTVEDKLILPLQVAGMGLLYASVELLALAPSLSSGAATDTVLDNPLAQYSSQLLTAIRPCLELGELVAIPGSSGSNFESDNSNRAKRRRKSRS